MRACRVGLFAISVNRNSYLIAKTLAAGGCQVSVHCEIPRESLLARHTEQGQAERKYMSWLYNDNEIQVIDPLQPPEVDVLLYEIGHHRPVSPAALELWMSRARGIVAWNTNDNERSPWTNFRSELGTLAKFWPYVWRTKGEIIQSGAVRWRPTSFFMRAHRQGYFVHPNFLREAELHEQMFERGWDPAADRPVRLIFSGNPEPPTRINLLRQLQHFLSNRHDVNILTGYDDVLAGLKGQANKKKNVLWMARAGGEDPKWHLRDDIIPPAKYPAVTRHCDFVICPPGHERKTHRVIESLLQGAIPALDCPEEYDVGLKDGVNCIVVNGGRWEQGVARALDYNSVQIKEMRNEIAALSKNYLHHYGAASRWLRRLGISEQLPKQNES